MAERLATMADVIAIRDFFAARKASELDGPWAPYGGVADLSRADLEAMRERGDHRLIVTVDDATGALRGFMLITIATPRVVVVLWLGTTLIRMRMLLRFLVENLPPNMIVEGRVPPGTTVYEYLASRYPSRVDYDGAIHFEDRAERFVRVLQERG